MKRLLTTAAALVALAIPAFAQEMRTVIDDIGREVQVPADPQRIIQLDDTTLGTPLADFGVPFVGSYVRSAEDGSLWMRGVDVYGLTLEGSDIAPVTVGDDPDFEAIAKLEPDLILLADWNLGVLEQLEAIAPTYVVRSVPDPWSIQEAIARAVGEEEQFEQRKAIYEERVEIVRDTGGFEEDLTYTFIFALEQGFWVNVGAYNLNLVLDDLGFVPSPFLQDMIDRGVVWGELASAEALPELDADIVLIGYGDVGETPQSVIANMEATVPNWCDFLPACAAGNVVLYDHTTMATPTFRGNHVALDVIGSHFASRLARGE
ncbi:MAG: ABC transporter substrate-binding protein [Pseudomonadota bacterium]